MAAPKTYQTEAIVLKKFPCNEADRILTLFTPHHGKIRAIAKGVSRPKSRMAGHLELLTRSQVLVSKGQNLDTISQSQTLESYRELREDLWRLSCALYMAELVDQVTEEEQENFPLYQLLLQALGEMAKAQGIETLLRYFELSLLEHLGYRPELRECPQCHSMLKPEENFMSPAAGGVLCPSCAAQDSSCLPISLSSFKVLRFWQKSDMRESLKIKLSNELQVELERLLKTYLRYQVERDLKSYYWLRRLKKEGLASTR